MTDLATKPVTESEIDTELAQWPEIDRGLLAEACRQTGLSPLAVINHALGLLVDQARERRMRAYDIIQKMVSDGLLTFKDIDGVDH